MSQRLSDPSSQSLQRPSANGVHLYPEDGFNNPRNMNGKRPRDEDQRETPRKRIRLTGDQHNGREESQQPSNPVAKASNLRQEQEFVDGPGRIIFIDERGKRCPAICFNKALHSTLNRIAVMSREMQERDQDDKKAQVALEQIKSSNQSVGLEEAKRKVEEAVKAQEEIEAKIPELVSARRHYENVVQDTKWSKMILENSREVARVMIEEILTRGNLLNIPSAKPQETIEDHTPRPAPAPENIVDHTQQSNVTGSSEATTIVRQHQHLIHQQQMTPYQLALRNYRQAATELDYRNAQLAFTQDEEYAPASHPAKPASATQTDLDLTALRSNQKAIRKALEAEAAYERAEHHATALGLGDILADPHACYWGEHFNEFRPEAPVSPALPINRSRIETWMASIPASGAVDPSRREDGERVGGDDWEAKPVEIFDSISVVARDMYRKKIDRWQELSGRLGGAEGEGSLRGDARRNPRRRCRDEKSPRSRR